MRPMQEPTFLILTALADGMQHGSGIRTDAARITHGRVSSPGNEVGGSRHLTEESG